MKSFLCAVTLILLVGLPVFSGAAQPSEKQKAEWEEKRKAREKIENRFKLYNHCRPLYLRVEPLFYDLDKAEKIGVTVPIVFQMFRNRLQATRMYKGMLIHMYQKGENEPYLYVNVEFLKKSNAFSFSIQFRKHFVDPLSGNIQDYATTWEDGTIGIHGGDRNFILYSISEVLDNFLTDYFEANEKACDIRFKK